MKKKGTGDLFRINIQIHYDLEVKKGLLKKELKKIRRISIKERDTLQSV